MQQMLSYLNDINRLANIGLIRSVHNQILKFLFVLFFRVNVFIFKILFYLATKIIICSLCLHEEMTEHWARLGKKECNIAVHEKVLPVSSGINSRKGAIL